ncbi:MAG: aminoglycoside phosphotransferase family protein [Pseudomonadales bacterium]
MSTTPGTPEADFVIDEPLVRALLEAQHPKLAKAALTLTGAGWDNITYRLGNDHAVRLPRRKVATTLIENEQRWLPELAANLPLAVPTPIATGRPQFGYPSAWSIVPWIEGETADLSPLAADQSLSLAEFLRALHEPAPSNAPINLVRGVPLQHRAGALTERLQRLHRRTDLITPGIDAAWHEALNAPLARDSRWLHGDFHPRNVLVDAGRIVGVIDWGDITSGDVATDLAGIWMLLPTATARASALSQYGADAATVKRAIGWAVLFGAVLLDSGLVDNPRHAAIGKTTLERVTEDFKISL